MEETVKRGIDEKDMLSNSRTIYDAGAGEVFFKNFLAGFGRALGGVFIYLIFIIAAYVIFMRSVYPKIQPIITQMTDLTKTLKNATSIESNPSKILPNNLNLQKFLGQ